MSEVIHFVFPQETSFYRNVAAVFGAAWLLRFLFNHARLLYNNFCAFVLPRFGVYKVDVTKYGSWAIVTGASEGIGRGYALELARRGLNVALVANAVREQYEREVRVIPVDFTDGQKVYSDIQAEISDLDVAVLVNNVGLCPSIPDSFQVISEQCHRDIIEVNCQCTVQMTHLVMPKMAEKGKGIIINVSSATSLAPSPFLNVYSATKIFISYFSSALQHECGNTGIIVQCVKPCLASVVLDGTYLTLPGLPEMLCEPSATSRPALAVSPMHCSVRPCVRIEWSKRRSNSDTAQGPTSCFRTDE